jgi:hypothetical protein
MKLSMSWNGSQSVTGDLQAKDGGKFAGMLRWDG